MKIKKKSTKKSALIVTLVKMAYNKLLTQPVLGLRFFHKVPVKKLVPGDVEELLSRVTKVKLTTANNIKKKKIDKKNYGRQVVERRKAVHQPMTMTFSPHSAQPSSRMEKNIWKEERNMRNVDQRHHPLPVWCIHSSIQADIFWIGVN